MGKWGFNFCVCSFPKWIKFLLKLRDPRVGGNVVARVFSWEQTPKFNSLFWKSLKRFFHVSSLPPVSWTVGYCGFLFLLALRPFPWNPSIPKSATLMNRYFLLLQRKPFPKQMFNYIGKLHSLSGKDGMFHFRIKPFTCIKWFKLCFCARQRCDSWRR